MCRSGQGRTYRFDTWIQCGPSRFIKSLGLQPELKRRWGEPYISPPLVCTTDVGQASCSGTISFPTNSNRSITYRRSAKNCGLAGNCSQANEKYFLTANSLTYFHLLENQPPRDPPMLAVAMLHIFLEGEVVASSAVGSKLIADS
jgi:hypothetical protein